MENHFVSDPGQRNDHQRPAGNLFVIRDTSVELAILSVSLSLFLHMNIDMKIIRPWNCSLFWKHPELSLKIDMKTIRPVNSWTLGLQGQAPLYWILGKYFTRNPPVLRQLWQKFCHVVIFWTNSTCFPMHHLMLSSDSSFQDKDRIWDNTNLCMRENDDFFIIDQRKLFPWKFPSWFDTLEKSHLFQYQLFRYPEHLFHREIFLNLDWMWIVWSILSRAYKCFHTVEDTNIHQNHKNVFQCLAFNLLEKGSASFAIGHSLCSRMNRIFGEKCSCAAVSESISISMTNLSSMDLPVLVFDISPDFHLRRHFSSAFHSE